MGKVKQQQQQQQPPQQQQPQGSQKKLDRRNLEISAPILDPEIIKAIHTPPKEQRVDLKHGGFKALLSDLNSQDSVDESPTPKTEAYVPSYIGISCAVSGYSGYSSYGKKFPGPDTSRSRDPNKKPVITQISTKNTLNRSRAMSPVARKVEPQVNHVTLDKSQALSADAERRELTEKLTASATERHRSPSPCIPPTEEDRHHGAYVGARYCPLPPPSKLVNKHIPLLGIDDDQDPDVVAEAASRENTVEHKIATLYGDKYVEDWKESNAHKKELLNESLQYQASNNKAVDEQTPYVHKVDLKQTKLSEIKRKSDDVKVESIDLVSPLTTTNTTFTSGLQSEILTPSSPPDLIDRLDINDMPVHKPEAIQKQQLNNEESTEHDLNVQQHSIIENQPENQIINDLLENHTTTVITTTTTVIRQVGEALPEALGASNLVSETIETTMHDFHESPSLLPSDLHEPSDIDLLEDHHTETLVQHQFVHEASPEHQPLNHDLLGDSLIEILPDQPQSIENDPPEHQINDEQFKEPIEVDQAGHTLAGVEVAGDTLVTTDYSPEEMKPFEPEEQTSLVHGTVLEPQSQSDFISQAESEQHEQENETNSQSITEVGKDSGPEAVIIIDPQTFE